MKQPVCNYFRVMLPGVLAMLFAVASCEGNLNQRMEKVSGTIKKVDSASVEVSKGITKFSKHIEGYVDTTAYKKDSTGMWHEKKVKKQGGVFDSIFK